MVTREAYLEIVIQEEGKGMVKEKHLKADYSQTVDYSAFNHPYPSTNLYKVSFIIPSIADP